LDHKILADLFGSHSQHEELYKIMKNSQVKSKPGIINWLLAGIDDTNKNIKDTSRNLTNNMDYINS